MELLKYGFESVRLGYNGDFDIIDYYYKNISSKWKKSISYTDFWKYHIYNVDYLFENYMSITDSSKIEKLRIEMDFLFQFDIWKQIINDFCLVESEFDLHDRFIKNYSIEIDWKLFRMFQIVFFRDYKMFWIGCIKIDAFYFLYNDKCSWKYNLFLKYMLWLDGDYLKRIDYYFDFNWKINDFLKQSIFRKFKTWSLFEWIYKKDNFLEVSEKSTVYWWSKKTKKLLVRLYNKWIDSVAKQKLKFYDYIWQETKRLEFSVEIWEISVIRKAIEDVVIYDFLKIVYKNTVLKQYKYALKNWKYNYIDRFEIPFSLDVDLYSCNCEKIKRSWKQSKENANQIKMFWGLARNLFDNVWEDEFNKILSIYVNKNAKLY